MISEITWIDAVLEKPGAFKPVLVAVEPFMLLCHLWWDGEKWEEPFTRSPVRQDITHWADTTRVRLS